MITTNTDRTIRCNHCTSTFPKNRVAVHIQIEELIEHCPVCGKVDGLVETTSGAEGLHTPEPWIAKELVRPNWVADWVLLFQDGTRQRRIDTNGCFDKDDARRIVACVNACEGMDDPAAEIAKMRLALEKLREDFLQMKAAAGPYENYAYAKQLALIDSAIGKEPRA